MNDKLTLRYPVIVEGKYDKARLASVVASPIVTLDGFGIFKNSEKKALIKKLCAENGIIILTDSDSAGRFIRSRLKGMLTGKIINVYTSEIPGKEKRKDRPSQEGLLGVEGIPADELRALLEPYAGIAVSESAGITKAEFYGYGLSGGSNSAEMRRKLADALGLPGSLTANALLEAINLTVSRTEFEKALDRITNEE